MPPSTTLIVILIAVAFSIGLGLGWIYSRNSDETRRSKLRTAIAIVVTVVWISATIADILLTGYVMSPLLHALMGAIVGYFFTEEGLTLNFGGQ